MSAGSTGGINNVNNGCVVQVGSLTCLTVTFIFNRAVVNVISCICEKRHLTCRTTCTAELVGGESASHSKLAMCHLFPQLVI